MNVFGILTQDTNHKYIQKLKKTFTRYKKATFKSCTIFYSSEVPIIKSKKFILLGECYYKTTRINSNFFDSKIGEIELIIDKLWGNFVLIYRKNVEFCIYKSLNLYQSIFYFLTPNDELIFASDVEILKQFLPGKIKFNLLYIYKFLLYNFFLSKSCLYQDIYELLPGFKVSKIGKDIVQEKMWMPNLSSEKIFDKEEFQLNLYHKLRDVIAEQIKNYKEVILEYSGGLDSTILLCILSDLTKASKQRLVAISYYHPLFNSSEDLLRVRENCSLLKAELKEINFEEFLPFSKLSNEHLFNKVYADLFWPGFNYNEHFEIGCGKACIINGEGGDELFSSPPIIESVADIILDRKIKIFFPKLKQMFSLSNFPIIHILFYSAKLLTSYFCGKVYRHIAEMNINYDIWFIPLQGALNNEMKPIFSYAEYFKGLKNIKPGKFYHLDLILNSLAKVSFDYKTYKYGNHIYAPLLSQPVIELALEVPSYEMYNEKTDRYLVRNFFAKKYPQINFSCTLKTDFSSILHYGLNKGYQHLLYEMKNSMLVTKHIVDVDSLLQNLQQAKIGSIYNSYWDIAKVISLNRAIKFNFEQDLT